MKESIKQKVHTYIHELAISRTSERDVAGGAAIGTFIAVLPTPGVSILLGLLVVLIYPKVNKLALFGSMVIWNPLTNIPLTILSYKIGDLIFGSIAAVKYDPTLTSIIIEFSRRYLLGNLIVALTISIISYVVVYHLVRMYRKKVPKPAKEP